MSEQDKYMKLKEQVAVKAWADPDFREKLMKDPKAALAEVFKFKINDSVDISIVEESEKNMVFVIPTKPSEELSDDELDDVAGGWGCVCDCFNVGCFELSCK